MVKKKNKSNNQTVLYVVIGVLALLVLNKGVGDTYYNYEYNTETINNLLQQSQTPSSSECKMTISDTSVCTGDNIVGTITDGKNANCLVFGYVITDFTSEWQLIYSGTTNNQGILTDSHKVNTPGKVRLRAVCDSNNDGAYSPSDCLTNYVDVTVTDCGTDDPEGDGDNGGDVQVVCNSAYPIPTSQSSCDSRVGCDSGEYCKFYPSDMSTSARCDCSSELGCNDGDFTQTNFEPSLKSSSHCIDATGMHLDRCEGGLLVEWHCPAVGDECRETYYNCPSFFGDSYGCTDGACVVMECSHNLDCAAIYGDGYVCRENSCQQVTSLNCAEVVQYEGKTYGYWDPIGTVGMTCSEHCASFCGGSCGTSSTGGTWGLCCGFNC